MNQNQMIFLLPCLAIIIYFLSYIKKRPTALFTFLGRSAAGLSYLYFFNLFCTSRGIFTYLGWNPITLILSAFLGIPGALLACAVNLFRFL